MLWEFLEVQLRISHKCAEITFEDRWYYIRGCDWSVVKYNTRPLNRQLFNRLVDDKTVVERWMYARVAAYCGCVPK